jgi:DNA-binding response OmpR family regulator
MVAVPHRPRTTSTASPTPDASTPRVAWLVLAIGGPALELADRRPDVAVRVVADPRRFRDLLVAERPRLVVVAQPPAGPEDLALVANERRRRPRLRAVHVAPADASTARLAALSLGFDDAVNAETSGAELAGRLAWLEERAAARTGRESRLPVGANLVLDLAARELRRGSTVVHLRPKEFGLLALLASQPGRVFTRRELLERAWGPRHPTASRTVDVHVRWLRTKIEPDPGHPVYLVTARGAGYRLDSPPALTDP